MLVNKIKMNNAITTASSLLFNMIFISIILYCYYIFNVSVVL